MGGLLKRKINNTANDYLEEGERIEAQFDVQKFNDYKEKQERTLIITNKSIVNMQKKTKVKRRIQINKITQITISLNSLEFVLHVPDEYDYRYVCYSKNDPKEAFDQRNSIIKLILLKQGMKEINIHFKEEASLVSYTTTKLDRKQFKTRIPKGPGQLMNHESFVKIISENQNEESDTVALFSSNPKHDTLFSDFLTMKVLGTNALGKVLLVEHKESGDWLALKCIRKDQLTSKSDRDIEDLENLIRNHKNTPFVEHLAYIIKSKHKYFIYTTFMRGGDITYHLQSGQLKEYHILRFYSGCIILGLATFHKEKKVYKSLNPSSVLMDDYGYVFLADFLWARFELTYQNTLLEKQYHYMAPETLESADPGKYAMQHDWWSFGMILFEMAFCYRPFNGGSRQELLRNIKETELEIPHNNIPGLTNLLKKLLQKNPSLRPSGSDKDLEAIILHEFYSNFQWDQLYKKQLQAPVKPNLNQGCFEHISKNV